jgi:hypothetical protein
MSSSSSGAGPSTTARGATALTGSMATGGSGAYHSVSHFVSWSFDVA